LDLGPGKVVRQRMASGNGGGVSSLRDAWDGLPIEAQRSIVSLAIQTIPINLATPGMRMGKTVEDR